MAFGDVEFRRMFGASGVFYRGLMIALVDDDVLYMKADKNLAREYEQRGLLPFSYNKQNKLVKLSYYQAPEEALEDPDELAKWAFRSYDVALRLNQK